MRYKIATAALLLMLGRAPALNPVDKYLPLNNPPLTYVTSPDLESSIEDTIKIASFNLNVFGQAKSRDREAIVVMKNIIRNFDIVAVQEIRDKTGESLRQLMREINGMPGPHYGCVLSPREGSTDSKEQYAFIFNTKTVYYNSSEQVFYDGFGQMFERTPFRGYFSAGKFDFVLINVHARPSNAVKEIGSLDLVVKDARKKFYPEDDLIVLGDLNADCRYFRNVKTRMKGPAYIWIVGDDADTTTGRTNCAYDRIIITTETAPNITGRWGVFDFQQRYKLSPELTKRVSDHFPVWAEFNTTRDID